MKILTRELKNKLSKMQEVLNVKSQIINGILVKNGKMTAYNLELGVTTNLNVDSNEEFIIPEKTINIINSISDEYVKITEKGGKINIKFGNTKLKHATFPVAEFPELPTTKNEKSIEFDLNEFVYALKSTAYATSKNEANASINGILVDCDGKTAKIVAVDGYRIATYQLETEITTKITMLLIIKYR